MPDWNFEAQSAEELDQKLRDILALENVNRGDEIYGTVHVSYTDDKVKKATLVVVLEERGIVFDWHPKGPASPDTRKDGGDYDQIRTERPCQKDW